MRKNYKTKDKKENLTSDNVLKNWRKYYYNHYNYHISRNRRYYLERSFAWYEWLCEVGYGECSRCGYNEHPKALDYHHRNPETKLFGIGKFVNGRQCNEENKRIVLDELKKCDCLCANCHRVHHFFEKNEHTNVS